MLMLMLILWTCLATFVFMSGLKNHNLLLKMAMTFFYLSNLTRAPDCGNHRAGSQLIKVILLHKVYGLGAIFIDRKALTDLSLSTIENFVFHLIPNS